MELENNTSVDAMEDEETQKERKDGRLQYQLRMIEANQGTKF